MSTRIDTQRYYIVIFMLKLLERYLSDEMNFPSRINNIIKQRKCQFDIFYTLYK
jgi:hypothetical protein